MSWTVSPPLSPELPGWSATATPLQPADVTGWFNALAVLPLPHASAPLPGHGAMSVAARMYKISSRGTLSSRGVSSTQARMYKIAASIAPSGQGLLTLAMHPKLPATVLSHGALSVTAIIIRSAPAAPFPARGVLSATTKQIFRVSPALSGHGALSAGAYSPYYSDNFNRADNHTSLGPMWTTKLGVIGIAGNAAYCYTNGAAPYGGMAMYNQPMGGDYPSVSITAVTTGQTFFAILGAATSGTDVTPVLYVDSSTDYIAVGECFGWDLTIYLLADAGHAGVRTVSPGDVFTMIRTPPNTYSIYQNGHFLFSYVWAGPIIDSNHRYVGIGGYDNGFGEIDFWQATTNVSIQAPVLRGPGVLSATARVKVTITAPVSGHGVVSATTMAKFARTCALAGAGVLSATASMYKIASSAALSGRGVLSAATAARFFVSAALPGHGASSAIARARFASSATFTGQSLLSTTAKAKFLVSVALPGHGVFSPIAIKGPYVAPAPLTGHGALSATATWPHFPPVLTTITGTGGFSWAIPYWCDQFDAVVIAGGHGGTGGGASFVAGGGGYPGAWGYTTAVRGSSIPWSTATVSGNVGGGGSGGGCNLIQGNSGGDSWANATGWGGVSGIGGTGIFPLNSSNGMGPHDLSYDGLNYPGGWDVSAGSGGAYPGGGGGGGVGGLFACAGGGGSGANGEAWMFAYQNAYPPTSSGALRGNGTLSATAGRATNLTDHGVLTATTMTRRFASVSLSGQGVLVSTARMYRIASSALTSGHGVLTATAISQAIPRSLALPGHGTLSATTRFPSFPPVLTTISAAGSYSYTIPYWADKIDAAVAGGGGAGGWGAAGNYGTGGGAGSWANVTLTQGVNIAASTITGNVGIGAVGTSFSVSSVTTASAAGMSTLTGGAGGNGTQVLANQNGTPGASLASDSFNGHSYPGGSGGSGGTSDVGGNATGYGSGGGGGTGIGGAFNYGGNGSGGVANFYAYQAAGYPPTTSSGLRGSGRLSATAGRLTPAQGHGVLIATARMYQIRSAAPLPAHGVLVATLTPVIRPAITGHGTLTAAATPAYFPYSLPFALGIVSSFPVTFAYTFTDPRTELPYILPFGAAPTTALPYALPIQIGP